MYFSRNTCHFSSHKVHKKTMKMGELHCLGTSPDSPLVVGVGGETELRVLNLRRNAAICQHFQMEALEPSVRTKKKAEKSEC